MLKNMSRSQKSILFVIVITMIALIVLMIFNINSKKGKKVEVINVVDRVNARDEYYNVKTCATKFFLYYSGAYNNDNYNVKYNNNTNNDSNKLSDFQNLYDFLDNEYIEKYEITKTNLSEKIPQISADVMWIDDIYKLQKRGDFSLYLVNASVVKKSVREDTKLNLLVKINESDKTFSVYLDNYIKDMEYDKLQIGDKKNIKLNSISNNLLGIYSPVYLVTDDTYAKDLYDDYINTCLYDKSRAYQLLDDSVKKEKFPTLDSYDKYLKENTSNMIINKFKSYSRIEEDGYVKYTCVDSKGNMYIFRETAPNKYTVVI